MNMFKKTAMSVLSVAIMILATATVSADYSINIGSDFESCTVGEKISVTGIDVVEKNSTATSGNRSTVRCVEYNGGKAAELTTYREDNSSTNENDGYFEAYGTNYTDVTRISFDFELKNNDYFMFGARAVDSDKNVNFTNILTQNEQLLYFFGNRIDYVSQNTKYSVEIVVDVTNDYAVLYLNDKMFETEGIKDKFKAEAGFSENVRTRIQINKTKIGSSKMIVDNYYVRCNPVASEKTAEVSSRAGKITVKDDLKEIKLEMNDVPSKTEPTISLGRSDGKVVDIYIKKNANNYCIYPDMDSIIAGKTYTLNVSGLKSYSTDFTDIEYVYTTPSISASSFNVNITAMEAVDANHIKVLATASTNIVWGEITKVEFYVNDVLYDTDKAAPFYTYVKTDNIESGDKIKAVAYDNYGNSVATVNKTLNAENGHLFRFEDVVIYAKDNAVSKKLENGGKAVCNIKNISDTEKTIMVVGAIYDGERFVNADIRYVTINADGSASPEFTIDKDYGENASFSAFYWNESDLRPHSDKYSANIYHEYTAEEVLEGLSGRVNIIGTDADFNKIRSLYNSDASFTALCNKVIGQADTYLAKDPPEYAKPDGLRLSSAYTTQDALENIAFAYKLTGDVKYAEGAKVYLDNAMAYTDWNNIAHYLDTSALMHGFAIAYDWCRDYFEENYPGYLAQLRAAVKTFGLERAEELYTGTTYEWHRFTHNINIVNNSGVIMAALICSEDSSLREYSAQIIAYALKSLSGALVAYSPDGAFAEGIGYWNYAGRNLASSTSSLVATTGKDFGCVSYDGMDRTLLYAEAMTGSTGITVNIHDGGSYNEQSFANMPTVSFFADYFDESAIKENRLNKLVDYKLGIEPYEIIWLSRTTDESEDTVVSGDLCFNSMSTASMCKDKSDMSSSYVMAHGGANSVPHGQLDIGNFIFESLGERWAIDLGKDDYNLDGYFEQAKRFNYYRNRAEAHNTLVMNISSGNYYDQPYEAEGKITDFISETDMAYTELDMTEAYADYVTSAIRRFKLDKLTGALTVTDNISFKSATELHWFMSTDAEVTLSTDKKSAMLKKNGKQLLVEIESDGDEIIELWAAEPYSSSPNPEGQAVNTGVTKLAIKNSSASGNYTLSVSLKPLV